MVSKHLASSKRSWMLTIERCLGPGRQVGLGGRGV
jgi:hypothetical protein